MQRANMEVRTLPQLVGADAPLPPRAAAVVTNLDDMLALVGNMFYQAPEVGRATTSYALLRRTTLGVLTSPIREPSVLGACLRVQARARVGAGACAG